MGEIEFWHGALSSSYEKQANKQGCTLGEDADFVQRLGDGLVLGHIHQVITDSEYDKILRRFQNKVLVPRLKPLKKKGDKNGR